MNIFYLDDDMEKSVQYHVDRHVVKMPVEATQMMCTVARERCGVDVGYRSIYINYPCTRWVGENQETFLWTARFAMALLNEYTYRYGKHHATELVLAELAEHKDQILSNLPKGQFIEPPKVVSAEFKNLPTVEAYRQYYIHVKSRLFKWTDRPVPDWIKETQDVDTISFS